MGRLDGRVAIVTGAGRGIGAAVAKQLAAEGARVVVNDNGADLDGTGYDEDPANEVCAAIRDAGGDAVPSHANVVDHEAAETIIQTALDSYGTLDVLVNTAGNLRDRMVFNMPEEDWDGVMAVHLKGTFNTTKFASIHWRAERKGHYRLINTTSVSGLFGGPGQPNYAAAKMGIVGFTYSCANALNRYGVTANAISPAAATRMGASVPEERRQGKGAPAASTSPTSPMAPENVAKPIAYIASEDSDWLNGRVIEAAGYRIGIYNKPEQVRTLVSQQPWELDDVWQGFETEIRPVVEGRP